MSENKFQQPSFIPKRQKKEITLLDSYGHFAILFLVVALIAMAFLFTFEKWLISDISKIAEKVQIVDEALEEDLFLRVRDVSQKVTLGEKMLSNGISSYQVINLINRNTVSGVSYVTANVKSVPSGNPNVVLGAQARSFGAVAFQSDVLKGVDEIQNFTIEGLAVSGGQISFQLNLNFKGSNLRRNTLDQ